MPLRHVILAALLVTPSIANADPLYDHAVICEKHRTPRCAMPLSLCPLVPEFELGFNGEDGNPGCHDIVSAYRKQAAAALAAAQSASDAAAVKAFGKTLGATATP